jgi:hypothetical protein
VACTCSEDPELGVLMEVLQAQGNLAAALDGFK